MSFFQKILGSSSGYVAEVDANNQLKIALSTTDANTGKSRLMTENNPESTGALSLKSPETAFDYRLRTGVDSLLFEDTFNATAQNTAVWRHVFSTQTMTQSGGFLNINNNQTATTATSCSLQTNQFFPVTGTAPIYAQFSGGPVAIALANQVFEFGLFVPNGSSAPADGIFFRYTSAGLIGVTCNNGVETVTSALGITLAAATNYKFTISCGHHQTEFWIDDGYREVVMHAAGNACLMLSGSMPASIQSRNTGTVSGSPVAIFKMGQVSISLADVSTGLRVPEWTAVNGFNHQGLNGGTMGQLCQFSNTAEPAAATATNTTAALGTGLGGLFKANAMASSATDLIISSYQNPAATVNITGRTLYITGCFVDVSNQVVAVATTAFMFQAAVAFGHTAVSLATTEGASFSTATTKAPRRVPIGSLYLPLAAPVGANSNQIRVVFNSPLVVYPGQFVALIVKPVLGTATATETLLFSVGFDHYFL